MRSFIVLLLAFGATVALLASPFWLALVVGGIDAREIGMRSLLLFGFAVALPMLAVCSLWLPILVSVRNASQSARQSALLLSPIPAVAVKFGIAFALNSANGHETSFTALEVIRTFVLASAFMMIFSGFFLTIDRRWTSTVWTSS